MTWNWWDPSQCIQMAPSLRLALVGTRALLKKNTPGRMHTTGTHPPRCQANNIGPWFTPEFYHIPYALPWGYNEPPGKSSQRAEKSTDKLASWCQQTHSEVSTGIPTMNIHLEHILKHKDRIMRCTLVQHTVIHVVSVYWEVLGWNPWYNCQTLHWCSESWVPPGGQQCLALNGKSMYADSTRRIKESICMTGPHVYLT